LSPIAIALTVSILAFAGAVLGMVGRSKLPEHEFSDESKHVLGLVAGLIGTMSALILGLLIASGKQTYDIQREYVEQLAADIIQGDTILLRYGEETGEARKLLQQSVTEAIEQTWPQDAARAANLTPPAGKSAPDAFFRSIQNLSPQTDAQRSAKDQVQQIAKDAAHMRLLIFVQRHRSISVPFLIVLVFWLVVLFTGFGLLTRINGLIVAALLVGAFSVGAAIFLVLALNSPFQGIMRLSSEPLESALARISQ
jgi:hypothetical protein